MQTRLIGKKAKKLLSNENDTDGKKKKYIFIISKIIATNVNTFIPL